MIIYTSRIRDYVNWTCMRRASRSKKRTRMVWSFPSWGARHICDRCETPGVPSGSAVAAVWNFLEWNAIYGMPYGYGILYETR